MNLIRESPSRIPPKLAIVGIVLIVAFAACGQRAAAPTPEDVVFVVDEELVGPVYESGSAGVRILPPVNWRILEEAQRRAVMDALASSQESGDYTLDVVDVFFDTDSMSFLSVSMVERTVRDPGDDTPPSDEYLSAFARTIGLSGEGDSDTDSDVVARTQFRVNDVQVTQFRHLRSNRITFTLMLMNDAGELVQLDYSIPTDTYQREAPKLESSIGTLELVDTDQH